MSSEIWDFFPKVNAFAKLMLYTDFSLLFRDLTEDQVSIYFFDLALLERLMEHKRLLSRWN